MSKKVTRIIAGNYNTNYERIDKNLIYYTRDRVLKSPSSEIDTFPNMWILSFSNLDVNQLHPYINGEEITLKGQYAVFAPPFSMIKFNYMSGVQSWSAFVSTDKLPESISTDPIIFPWSPDSLPTSSEEIINIVMNAKNIQNAKHEIVFNATALKIKQLIDLNFMDHYFPISKIASKVGITHSFLSRIFKKSYGISPITYRNRLRIFESSKMLLFGEQNVTGAAQEVGFLDSSRFNKQFSKELHTKPSDYYLEK